MVAKDLSRAGREEYVENVKGLNLLEVADVANLKEDAYIYFGRVTCPYCREFSQEFPDATVKINYIDTENTDLNPELQALRDKYEVKTVPTFIHLKADGSYTKLNRDVRQTIADFVAAQG